MLTDLLLKDPLLFVEFFALVLTLVYLGYLLLSTNKRDPLVKVFENLADYSLPDRQENVSVSKYFKNSASFYSTFFKVGNWVPIHKQSLMQQHQA